MNGCISWNRVKAWSSIQRKFQMISERRKFLSPFLTFAMSAVQIFNAKKPACKVLQYFKIVWVFFNSLFFLRIRIEGKESFHQGDHNLVFIRHKTWSLNAFPPLRACFIEWLSSRTFTLQFEGNLDAAVSFSREKASVGSCWWRCQDGLERFPVAHTTFQEIGSQDHHGW